MVEKVQFFNEGPLVNIQSNRESAAGEKVRLDTILVHRYRMDYITKRCGGLCQADQFHDGRNSLLPLFIMSIVGYLNNMINFLCFASCYRLAFAYVISVTIHIWSTIQHLLKINKVFIFYQ